MGVRYEKTKYPGIARYRLANKPGWFYRVWYRNSRGRSTDKSGFETLTAARAWKEKNAASIRDGSYVSPTDGRTTINEIVDDLLAAKGPAWKESYKTNWTSCWEARIQPEFGHLSVSRVSRDHIQDWINELHSIGLASKTCRNYLNYIRGILEHAIKLGAASMNASKDVTPPRKQPMRPRRYLSEKQVKTIARHLEGTHRAIFLVLAYTGLRWGELAGLEVGSVNLNTRRLTVRRAVGRIRRKGGGWQIGTPKNGKERRVGFPPHIADELRPYLTGKDRTDLVFPPEGNTEFMDQPGAPGSRKPTMKLNWLWIACDSNGIAPVSVHELRHTYASLAVSSGANVKVLQKSLGHATAAMTLDVYSDLFEDDLDTVADRMGASWDEDDDVPTPPEDGEAPTLALVS